MLINRWLVSDTMPKQKNGYTDAGICLKLGNSCQIINGVYKLIQQVFFETPIAIMLSCDDRNEQFFIDADIESLIALFFQPSYYKFNFRPIIFLSKQTSSGLILDFLERINKRCKDQGFQDILIFEINSDSDEQFVFWQNDCKPRLDTIVKSWLKQSIDNKMPPEIHLMFNADYNQFHEILITILEEEKNLRNSDDFIIAGALYQKQILISEYEYQVMLNRIAEKNSHQYLSVQKKEREKVLKWYYYEYEILPLWYKRLGHLIKVIKGKRTFQSLFNDNVKKYKD